MRRETKLGLVVSGSFLCLLGAVIGRKLLSEDVPAPPPLNQAVVASATPAPSPTLKTNALSKMEKDTQVIDNNQIPELSPVQPAKYEGTKPLPSAPAVPPKPGPVTPPATSISEPPALPVPLLPGNPGAVNGTDLPSPGAKPGLEKEPSVETELEIQTKKAQKGSFPALNLPATNAPSPVLPTPADIAQAANPLPKGPPVPNGVPPIPPTEPVASGIPLPEPPAVSPTPSNTPGPLATLPPPAPGSAGLTPLPPVPTEIVPATAQGNQENSGLPLPAPEQPTEKSALENKNKSGIPELPPGPEMIPPTPPVPIPVPAVKPANAGDPPQPPASLNIEAPIPVRPSEDKKPAPVVPPMPPVGVGETPTLATPPMPVPVPVVDAEPQQNNEPKNPPGLPSSPPGTSVAPLGQPPGGAVNPMNSVQVSDYLVETFHCQADTLDFRAISKKVYLGSERYADALLLFNREHPNASASLKQEPPELKVGQPVYIPPVAILEARFAQAIKNYKPPVVAQTPPVVNNSPPVVPKVGAPVKISEIPAQGSLQQTAGGPIYQVKGNSEMLYEIARQTLGDGRRWSDIFRLNPQIDPRYPIPVGTQLRLPAGSNPGN